MASLLSKLDQINRQGILAAGPRYSPGVEAGAPNLTITSLSTAIESLGQTPQYKQDLLRLESLIRKAWSDAPYHIQRLFSRRAHTPTALADLLSALSIEKPGDSTRTLSKFSTVATTVTRILSREQQKLWNTQYKNPPESKKTEAARLRQYQLNRFQEAIRPSFNFLGSPDFRLVSINRMFIRGEWGTGKTHFLCDISRLRSERKLPTLLLLAHRLPANNDILTSIRKATNIAKTNRKFLERLDRLGKTSNGRTLLIIDGINEGDRAAWKKGLHALVTAVNAYPNLGLVISCRSPFDQQIFTDKTRRKFIETVHRGFQEIEFDAQREFFKFYKIPTPQVPLLVAEFSRPLFLRILCKTFAGLSAASKTRRIHDFASGQKGMTKLFEDFIDHVGTAIERDFNLRGKTCWRILKGHKIKQNNEIFGIAVTMADQITEFLPYDKCIEIIKGITRFAQSDAESLLRRMIADGLLIEDTVWQNGVLSTVIRLSYQRFSDHLICRHLLEKHLDSRSEQTIRRSFHRNKPLGKIFEIDSISGTYRFPGLASALMLEFPERVKRTLPHSDRELVFYLPKNRRYLSPLAGTFLEGLLWRDTRSFSTQTDRVVAAFLARGELGEQNQTLETLLCLASRPGHPYSAERLTQYLSRQTLVDRDLLWSEFLRTATDDSVSYRLMDWIEIQNARLTAQVAHTLIQILALFLTTTNRPLRDRATKMLVLIGEVRPAELFKMTLEYLKFNDPYIPERMLAACYGVAMRCWAFPTNDFINSISNFANELFALMFATTAPYTTKHYLTRDYALGVLDLAKRIRGAKLRSSVRRKLKPPFPGNDPIPDATTISEKECEPAKTAIRMDFENYTIGHLAEGRSNYDFNHAGYRGILRQIKWRILDLGYSPKNFETIDAMIDQYNFYREQRDRAAKIDRYGKKYSWIAFFEVNGMRQDRGSPPNRWDDVRPSDCDIDPSFPSEAPEWSPSLKPIYARRYKSDKNWIENGPTPNYESILTRNEVQQLDGPWVLLDGYINELHKDDREIFSFLRGLLISPDDIPKIEPRLATLEYPGNDAIPQSGDDHYTFAGEIPWSDKYARHYRTKTGQAKRIVREALEQHVSRKVRKRTDKLSIYERLVLLNDNDLPLGFSQKKIEPSQNSKFTEVTVFKRVPGFKVELPHYGFAWESYHSSQNQIGSVDFIAPKICESFDLKCKSGCVDLYDPSGKVASLSRNSGNWPGTQTRLLYLRRDLLRKYLEKTGQQIIWIVWGERSFKSEKLQSLRDDLQSAWSKHTHIHKRLIVGDI